MGEEPAAKTDQSHAKAEQRPRVQRRREDDAAEGDNADKCARSGDAMGVRAEGQTARSERKARAAAQAQASPSGRWSR